MFLGIGHFNASSAFTYEPNQLALVFAEAYSEIFDDPSRTILLQTNLSCQSCASYFFPGSIIDAQYWLEPILNNRTFDVLTANDALGLQIDFSDVPTQEPAFELNNECLLIGDDAAAMVICLRNSILGNGTLIAGSFPLCSLNFS
jgi:hypothetical protein